MDITTFYTTNISTMSDILLICFVSTVAIYLFGVANPNLFLAINGFITCVVESFCGLVSRVDASKHKSNQQRQPLSPTPLPPSTPTKAMPLSSSPAPDLILSPSSLSTASPTREISFDDVSIDSPTSSPTRANRSAAPKKLQTSMRVKAKIPSRVQMFYKPVAPKEINYHSMKTNAKSKYQPFQKASYTKLQALKDYETPYSTRHFNYPRPSLMRNSTHSYRPGSSPPKSSLLATQFFNEKTGKGLDAALAASIAASIIAEKKAVGPPPNKKRPRSSATDDVDAEGERGSGKRRKVHLLKRCSLIARVALEKVVVEEGEDDEELRDLRSERRNQRPSGSLFMEPIDDTVVLCRYF